MKTLALLVLTLLLVTPASAQKVCPSANVIQDITSKMVLSKMVLYSDSLETRLLSVCDSGMIEYQLAEFRNHSRKYVDTETHAVVKFTHSEKDYLIAELRDTQNRTWGKDELPSMNKLSPDSLLQYLIGGRGTIPMRSVLQLSKPVFIRECSLCLVFSSRFYGGIYGPVRLAIYKESDGHWSPWITLSEGAF